MSERASERAREREKKKGRGDKKGLTSIVRRRVAFSNVYIFLGSPSREKGGRNRICRNFMQIRVTRLGNLLFRAVRVYERERIGAYDFTRLKAAAGVVGPVQRFPEHFQI